MNRRAGRVVGPVHVLRAGQGAAEGGRAGHASPPSAHNGWKETGRLRTFGDLKEAIVEGAAQRIRPKLMTVLTDMIGPLPVLLSVGTGADLMKRIAAPLVGGITTSFLLELTVYPAIFAIWKGRGLAREREAKAGELAGQEA